MGIVSLPLRKLFSPTYCHLAGHCECVPLRKLFSPTYCHLAVVSVPLSKWFSPTYCHLAGNCECASEKIIQSHILSSDWKLWVCLWENDSVPHTVIWLEIVSVPLRKLFSPTYCHLAGNCECASEKIIQSHILSSGWACAYAKIWSDAPDCTSMFWGLVQKKIGTISADAETAPMIIPLDGTTY